MPLIQLNVDKTSNVRNKTNWSEIHRVPRHGLNVYVHYNIFLQDEGDEKHTVAQFSNTFLQVFEKGVHLQSYYKWFVLVAQS